MTILSLVLVHISYSEKIIYSLLLLFVKMGFCILNFLKLFTFCYVCCALVMALYFMVYVFRTYQKVIFSKLHSIVLVRIIAIKLNDVIIFVIRVNVSFLFLFVFSMMFVMVFFTRTTETIAIDTIT